MKRLLILSLSIAVVVAFCQGPQQSTVYQTICTNSAGCNVDGLRNIGQAYHVFMVTWKDAAPAVCATRSPAAPAGTFSRAFLRGGTAAVMTNIPLDTVAFQIGGVAANRWTQIYRGSGGFPRLGFFLTAPWNPDCLVDVSYVGSMASVVATGPLTYGLTPVSMALVAGANLILADVPEAGTGFYSFAFACDVASTLQLDATDTRVGGATQTHGMFTASQFATFVLPLTNYAQFLSPWPGWTQWDATVVMAAPGNCTLTFWSRQE